MSSAAARLGHSLEHESPITVFEPWHSIRVLVGPVGALQAVLGRCTPQAHLPWADPLDSRRQTVRSRVSGARKAERSFGAMYFSWPGGPRWRATSGLWVCAPQAHLPWVGPLDSRRQTVRSRPLRSAQGGTQFWSHVFFVAWRAPLARYKRSLGVCAPGTLAVGRPARQPPSDRPMQASPVRKRRNAVLEPSVIRRLVRPTGAALAVIGRASSLGVTVIIPHTLEHQNGPGLSAVIRGTA